jgi:toxin CptA
LRSDDVLSFQTRRGERIDCAVQGDTYVLWFLTVLNLGRSDDRKRISVLILPDGIDTDDFRRLRVWLRWKADKTPALK